MSNFQHPQQREEMYISTTDTIPGMNIIGHYGLVFGATVRAQGPMGDCLAGCQAGCGGEVSAYTEMAIDARNQAISRMLDEARQRGANAVIGLKFDSDNMGGGQGAAANGTICYATAVRVEPAAAK